MEESFVSLLPQSKPLVKQMFKNILQENILTCEKHTPVIGRRGVKLLALLFDAECLLQFFEKCTVIIGNHLTSTDEDIMGLQRSAAAFGHRHKGK